MLPNFLYIGPDKSGSTWIYETLKRHPDIYVPKIKDIYYFDKYFYRGTKWYESFFESARNRKAIGELSHDYMYSKDAARRIKECIPNVKLVTCLRDPVDRAVSCYNYCVRLGLVTGEFEEAAKRYPTIVSNSFYFKALKNYFEYFDRSQIFVLWYKDLVAQPLEFARQLFRILEVNESVADSASGNRVLEAGAPRNVILARTAKHAAKVLRHMGFITLLGHLKSSTLVQKSLYKSYSSGVIKSPEGQTRDKLRKLYYPDILQLQELLDVKLSSWYPS